MACYYPMEAARYYDGSIKILGEYLDGFHTKRELADPDIREFLTVPCGKCIGCRLEYSRQWAIRCLKELETTQGPCWFLTLTYDDLHLPRKQKMEINTGITLGIPTLVPKHLQDFIKRLRERLRRDGKSDFRYYACGEYGDQYQRPHYHLICFNLPLEDLVFKFAKNGHQYYTSKFIDEVWGLGNINPVSDVNFECCAYVARYVMKKAKGPNGFSYASDNEIEEEFVRMSRRPGIGRAWYEAHKHDIYKYECRFNKDGIYSAHFSNDSMFVFTQKGSIQLKPVKYYDKLFDVEFPEYFDDLKEQRKLKAEKLNCLKMSQTSVTPTELRSIMRREKEEKIKLLKRDFESNGVIYK